MFCVHCLSVLCFFFFKQKTAYEMRISDWSSDVCSSDLNGARWPRVLGGRPGRSCQEGRLWRHAAEAGDRRRGQDRKSVVSGKSVSVRVDLGGRRIIKKKKKKQCNDIMTRTRMEQEPSTYKRMMKEDGLAINTHQK